MICKPLREPNITARQVLAAPDACALGIEIVASRIADWKIQLVDTIADNASYGGFTLGPWDKKLRDSDLSALAMSIRKNGALAGEGLGSAVLGNPAIAAAWLANNGAFMKMLPFEAGDQFVFSLSTQPDLTVTFS